MVGTILILAGTWVVGWFLYVLSAVLLTQLAAAKNPNPWLLILFSVVTLLLRVATWLAFIGTCVAVAIGVYEWVTA